MYSTHNELKLIVVEVFTGTLKTKIINTWFQYEKNGYVDKPDDTVNKYNKAYHRATKVKPADVKSSKRINFSMEIMINYSKEVVVIKKIRTTVLWLYMKDYLNCDEIAEHFWKKNFKRQIKRVLLGRAPNFTQLHPAKSTST